MAVIEGAAVGGWTESLLHATALVAAYSARIGPSGAHLGPLPGVGDRND
jgi:enoyl-CoA hydratase/carnithine racemase